MTTQIKKNLPDSIAKIISVLFHPLFMPVYGLAIILSPLTPFGYLPIGIRKLVVIIILINNVFLPASLLPFFVHMNYITSWALSDRKERVIPLIITTVLYAATSYIVFRFPVPFYLKSFIYSTFFLSLTLTIINFKWKISIHSAGAGALIAIVLHLALKMYAPLPVPLIAVLIAGALVLSSRLRLNLHNPLQVWSGFFTGLFGFIIFMMLLQHLA